MREQNYFALDLELNNLKNGKTPKIIQVGVAIGNVLYPQHLQTVSWYLDPQEEISPEITALTGITNEVIQEKAVPHEQVAKELGILIDTYKCFVNPVTWGQGDAQELKNEFRDRGVDFPFFGRRIIDVKTVYVFKQIAQGKTPSGGLKKSMHAYGIPFEGQPHRADVDALNTLRFFFHLIGKENQVIESVRTLQDMVP